jgi:hypothetical protein
MAMTRVSSSPNPRRRNSKSYALGTVLSLSGGLGFYAILLWLIVGVVALFFGSGGGGWGWGFGFGWYFTLLSMAVAIIAGMGIAISIIIWRD